MKLKRLLSILLVALLPVLLVAFGCSSTPDRPVGEPLAYHLAVVPFDVSEKLATVPAEDEKILEEATLALPADNFAAMLAEQLRKDERFTRVTLLARPAGVSLEEFQARPLDQRNEHWLAEARRAGADLVLCGRAEYTPAVRSRGNEKFYLNLPLFLFVGPLSYIVDDRTYLIDVNVRGWIVDANLQVPDPLSDQRAVLDVLVEHSEIELDFIERADGAGDYAKSIIVPTGFLANDNEDISVELQTGAVAAVAMQVSDKILEGRSFLAENNKFFDFYLDEWRIVEPGGDEPRVLQAQLVLQKGTVDSLEHYEIETSAGTERYRFRDPEELTDGRRIYRLAAALPREATGARLKVYESSAEQKDRSFTLGQVSLENVEAQDALYRKGQ
jgi:hypothetical protein